MKTLSDYLVEIKKNLMTVNPYKLILFGSVSEGDAQNDSDIDLLVILDSDEIAANYEEKMRNKLMVRKCIYDISKEIPIDLLVYTRKEYEIIEHNKKSFFKEINVTGTVLYEKAG